MNFKVFKVKKAAESNRQKHMAEIKLDNKKEENIKDIAEKYGLKLLLLFGSRAKDEKYIREDSDFDIAYLSEKDLDANREIELNCDLINIFGSDKVDLVNIKKAQPLLLFAITNDCKVLFEKTFFIFSSLRVCAFRRYIDTKPFYEEKFIHLHEKIRKIKI